MHERENVFVSQIIMNACTTLSDNFFSVSTADEAYKLIQDFKTQNTVKFSCYKAKKDFGGTGKRTYKGLVGGGGGVQSRGKSEGPKLIIHPLSWV